jgi:hypothetical protein
LIRLGRGATARLLKAATPFLTLIVHASSALGFLAYLGFFFFQASSFSSF